MKGKGNFKSLEVFYYFVVFSIVDFRIFIYFIKFSKLLVIKRNDFIELLNEYPSQLEKFNEIKDNILLESNYEKIGIKCFSCQSLKHGIEDCSWIHHSPDNYKII